MIEGHGEVRLRSDVSVGRTVSPGKCQEGNTRQGLRREVGAWLWANIVRVR
jgi:hypothetical protein